ncbi:MAG: hypothetical protein ACFFD7_15175 [Candidatus Thorarchaeota archaeon]
MLGLILLFIDFVLFLLSFVSIILDISKYKENKYEDLPTNKFPKWSARSLLFGLLALILAVIVSLLI